jgi:transposase-like protein
MFWEWFEHLTLDELCSKVNTECEYCSSQNIEVTSETRFAGGDIGYRHYQRFRCGNCRQLPHPTSLIE